ncbi:MAG: hypothetical protein JXB10_09025 [Pirellulales bacterium]|nr:hypothetical protein [Pirellulales bacterium]
MSEHEKIPESFMEEPPKWLTDSEQLMYSHGRMLIEEIWAAHDLPERRRGVLARSLDWFYRELLTNA